MKNMINRIFGLLLIAAVAVATPLHGMKKTAKKIETPIERVAQEVSLLDQIMEQAEKVINAENKKAKYAAHKNITTLMNNKNLDTKIKELISGDIGIIQGQTLEKSQKAYDHLLEIVAQINAQANVIAVTAQATELIENAPEAEKPGMMRWAYQKIQEATQAAQSMITTPVNYVFGEESSSAKTAFYATVGAFMLYGTYQYGGDLLKSLKPKSEMERTTKEQQEMLPRQSRSPIINDTNKETMQPWTSSPLTLSDNNIKEPTNRKNYAAKKKKDKKIKNAGGKISTINAGGNVSITSDNASIITKVGGKTSTSIINAGGNATIASGNSTIITSAGGANTSIFNGKVYKCVGYQKCINGKCFCNGIENLPESDENATEIYNEINDNMYKQTQKILKDVGKQTQKLLNGIF